MENARGFKMPYRVDLHMEEMLLCLSGLIPENFISLSMPDCLASIARQLGSSIKNIGKFKFPKLSNSQFVLHANNIALNLLSCGCTTKQAVNITGLSNERVLLIRRTLAADGVGITRNKGSSRDPYANRRVQRKAREDIFMALCCYVRERYGADDLQAVVAGTFAYTALCHKLEINRGIDVSLLIEICRSNSYEARKCPSCGSLFLVDNMSERNTRVCCFCNSGSKRSWTGHTLGMINNRSTGMPSAMA